MKVWRGPFRVERRFRRWVIVNASGELERLGYAERSAATTMCDIMNLAGRFCDDAPDDAISTKGQGVRSRGERSL